MAGVIRAGWLRDASLEGCVHPCRAPHKSRTQRIDLGTVLSTQPRTSLESVLENFSQSQHTHNRVRRCSQGLGSCSRRILPRPVKRLAAL